MERGGLQPTGRRFHVYIALFREQQETRFDFVDEFKTEYSQLPDLRFPALPTEGKRKLFLFRLINQSIYALHICAEKWRKAFYFLLNDQSVADVVARGQTRLKMVCSIMPTAVLLSWNGSNYSMYF